MQIMNPKSICKSKWMDIFHDLKERKIERTTPREIAEDYGGSREWARQILKKMENANLVRLPKDGYLKQAGVRVII